MLLPLLLLAASADANAHAREVAGRSPAVTRARGELLANVRRLHDPKLRRETQDLLRDSGVCVVSRRGVDATEKQRLLAELVRAGYLEQPDARVFPPLQAEDSACPEVPQSFFSAPGSVFHGHHSYPGGLALHENTNQRSALALAATYRENYRVEIDEDLMVAAPVWHDWAKTIVFQWKDDGSELEEATIAGTPAHHIIGLAESMARGLSPELIRTQASAHAAPALGNQGKVVAWIRAAALLARVDPVKAGYLDARGALPHLRAEYALHNLSDADFNWSIPAVEIAEKALRELSPVDAKDSATYNNQWRNPLLSALTAERIAAVEQLEGREALRKLIDSQPNLRLRRKIAPSADAASR